MQQVFVRGLENTTLVFDIASDSTLLQLKRRISARLHLPVAAFRLYRHGRQLRGDALLLIGEHFLEPEASLHLTLNFAAVARA